MKAFLCGAQSSCATLGLFAMNYVNDAVFTFKFNEGILVVTQSIRKIYFGVIGKLLATKSLKTRLILLKSQKSFLSDTDKCLIQIV
jgi:hypothetical protein